MPFLRLTAEFELPLYPGTGENFCVVGGGWWWWVCKPILVFYFGPNQALGLRLRLGPSQTIFVGGAR